MYRRSAPNPIIIVLVVLFGIIAGVVIFANDQAASNQPASAPELILLPSSTPPPRIQPTAIETLVQPTPLALPTNEPEVTLVIPNANVATQITHIFISGDSWNVSQLGRRAGHLSGTAWLNQTGNIVLAGHVEMADGSPGIFAHIKDLRPGNELLIMQSGETRVYRVDAVRRVKPDDLSVLYPSPGDKLTLITCDSYDFLSNIYLDRIVVVSSRIT